MLLSCADVVYFEFNQPSCNKPNMQFDRTHKNIYSLCFSAHDSFKTCVIEETKECPCEGDSRSCRDQTQTASHFAKIIVDNSLGFLLKQCKSIV